LRRRPAHLFEIDAASGLIRCWAGEIRVDGAENLHGAFGIEGAHIEGGFAGPMAAIHSGAFACLISSLSPMPEQMRKGGDRTERQANHQLLACSLSRCMADLRTLTVTAHCPRDQVGRRDVEPGGAERTGRAEIGWRCGTEYLSAELADRVRHGMLRAGTRIPDLLRLNQTLQLNISLNGGH
jgi:hypothetical protein